MYSRAVWCRFLAALLFAALAGCLQVPGQELTTYREAFLEAKNAGVLLYDELGASVLRAGGGPENQNCARSGAAAPACFDPYAAENPGAGSSIPEIRARLLALETITLYNLAIVDLLEGKSEDALGQRIKDLQAVASDLLVVASISSGSLPGLINGPALGLLGGLVDKLDGMRVRALAAQSLRANIGTVREIIGLLIDDTPRMYTLYRRGQGKYAAEVEIAAGSNDAVAMAAWARIGAYHDQLTAYVKVLNQTRDSADRLVEAMERGAGSTDDLRAVIREAIEIRAAAGEFWDAVRASR